MADTVTLESYLAELNILFENESFSEVISHCRHILHHYPQNVETYRLLAKALLQRGIHETSKDLFDEAAQIFTRVLTVWPNDYVAHLGLSEISEYNNDLNLAIWHMERAYEQTPGNTVLQDAMRDLYAKRDGEAHAPQKIHLTRGALARQYADGQLYDQALLELRAALEQAPDRVDLQVLQAETLWASQHYVEAGEVAIQILNKLPNCLSANRILAQLWLAYERPTDAQVFLDHVEAVDPYEAMRLLQADEEAEDVNELPRLDYNAQAAAALSTETPDWVQDLEGLGERGFDMGEAQQTPEAMLPPSPDRIDTEALFGSSSPGMDWFGDSQVPEDEEVPDWFADLGKAEIGAIEESGGPEWLPPVAPQPSFEDLFGGAEPAEEAAAVEPEWLGAVETGAEPQPSFEDLFGETEPVEHAAAAPEWLGAVDTGAEPQPSFEDLFGEAVSAEEAAAPEWLGAVGSGAEPQPSFENLFGDSEEEPAENTADAVESGWLGAVESGTEPQPSFEDLFGEAELAEAASAAVEPEWLGAAESGAEPQPSFEDLFGETEPAEHAAAAPEWLGAVGSGAEPQPSFENLFGDSGEEPAEDTADAVESGWLGAVESGTEPQPSFEDLFGDSREERAEDAAAVEPEWLGAVESGTELQPSFEDLFGDSGEEPAEDTADAVESGWLGAVESGTEPQPSFEDLFGEAELAEAASAAVEPEWLGAAESGAEPQPSFEDLFGDSEEEPAEDAADAVESGWLGAVETGTEPQVPLEIDSGIGFARLEMAEKDVTPSGFTDLLQNIETSQSAAPLLESMDEIEPTPPDWLASFEGDVKTDEVITPQEEIVIESRDEPFDWSAFEDITPEPGLTELEAVTDLAPAESEDQMPSGAPDWMVEPELDFFAPASDDIQTIAPPETPGIQPLVEDRSSLEWLGPEVQEEEDWLGSFARPEPEPASLEPTPSFRVVDQIRETDEWLAEIPDLELETAFELSLEQPVSFDEVEKDLFGVEETEVPETPVIDDKAAPAWMADLEPVDEALPEPDVLTEAYDSFEAGSSAQEPGYRVVGDTGVLQPDEQPDWMAAFTGEELPAREDEVDTAAQEDAFVLDGLFNGEEEVETDTQPDLSEITFDDIEAEEVRFEPDTLAPPAEEEGEMPDWLIAITSSEADKLDDMLFAETEETYSISTADSGVLQPDEQPDWLVQVGEPAQAAPVLAQPDDLAHTKEIVPEDEWTEVDAEDDEDVPADFTFDDVVPAWLRQPKESDLALPSHDNQEIASEMPEWLRDVMEDDDIGE